MNQLEEIRSRLEKCDDIIIHALNQRMQIIEEIIEYKRNNGVPILQPEQEKKQRNILKEKLDNHKFEDEILDIFTYIVKNSRKVQAKSLFSYNIMLIGFMGVGKSTVSAKLSEMLAMDEIETDALIVEKERMSIADIFEKYGELYFRNCETNLLIELQERTRAIVSCGGGMPLRDENVACMKKGGRVVLLTASPETILERVKDSDERPILRNHKNVEFISDLMQKRADKYMAATDIIVDTDNKSALQVCEEIISKLTAMDRTNKGQK